MGLSFDELELESAEYVPAREVMTTTAALGTVTGTVNGLLGTVDAGETVSGVTSTAYGALGTVGADDTVAEVTTTAYGVLGTAGGLL